MAIKKLFSGVLVFLFINLFICAQTEFNVQGKLVRNGKGFKGVGMRCFPLDKDKIDEKYIITTTTNANGEFSFYCPQGQYEIEYFNDDSKNDDLIYMGPDGYKMPYKFSIDNRNLVFKRNFVAYTKLEIIERSKDILSQTNPNLKCVLYKWGKIPIYSLEECKQAAEENLDMVKSMYGSIPLVKKAYIGNPVVFFDFDGNAAFYQFPIMIDFIEVSYIGIHAIGDSPETLAFYVELVAETEEEIQNMINAGKKNKFTLDRNIPSAIEVLANKLQCPQSDIHLEKLLYWYGGTAPVYALLKNILNNNLFAINLDHYNDVIGPLSLSESSLDSQLEITFEYVMDLRYKKIPLFE